MTAPEALIELLDIADEDDEIRTHRLTQEGAWDRMETIWPELVKAWCASQLQQRDEVLR